MKRMMVVLLLGAAAATLAAFDEPLLYGLRTPSHLVANQFVLDIEHRFYGTIQDPMLGMEAGSNVGLGLRYHVWAGLEVNAGYVRDYREFGAGASYSYLIRPLRLRTQASFQLANYVDDYATHHRTNALWGLVSLQTMPLLKVFTPALDVGYDIERSQLMLGIGLGVGVPVAFGPLKRVGLAAEYYPHLASDTLANCFAGALFVETWGHQFMFGIGNTSSIGDRFLTRGTGSDDLHFGFSVRRKLDLATF